MSLFNIHICKLPIHLLLGITIVFGVHFHLNAQNFITPDLLTELDGNLDETSGLINLDGEIWTHNDKGGEAELYQIDITDGSILRTVTVQNATNIDWEDLANDDVYVYIGDFGNNDGSRTDLKIYKISRYALNNYDEVYADIITFSYNDQTSFEPNYHNTNFDCEALISFQNDLYLFTKNWVDYQTNCYKLSNQPGDHVAQHHATFDVNCLITGSEIKAGSNLLILIGYNLSGGSYTWLFDDFEGENFFEGEDTKLIWTSLTQIEGICQRENNEFYISSENIPGVSDPMLYSVDVSEYVTSVKEILVNELNISYNDHILSVTPQFNDQLSGTLQISDIKGHILIRKYLMDQSQVKIGLDLPSGIYIVLLKSDRDLYTSKFLVP